ncbi:MAG: zf-HC2 domain-containing protein [Acidobacteriota bacterium]|nr:hypothetical protein [Blastocatellia bacterium]MDW8412929.1 zf-HC2 domain-containing protein [Acidobacteriota bacterium]
MNCKTVKTKASQFIDKQLPKLEANLLLAHLRSCDQCSKDIEELSECVRLLKSLKPEAVPEQLVQNIILRAKQSSSSSQLSFRLASAVAALACIAVLVYFPSFRKIEDKLVAVLSQPETPLNDTAASVESTQAIVELALIEADSNRPHELFVVAEVSDKGKARLLHLVGHADDPVIHNKVDEVLKRASFRPAIKDGKPVASTMLFFIEAIDIQG